MGIAADNWRVSLFALLGGVASLFAPAPAHADDWPSRGLEFNQRVSAERIGAAFEGARWSFTLPNAAATVATPAVADGYLVFGAFDGVVRAIGAVDGKLRWETKLGDGVYATPVIDRGRVFVPALDRQLYALALHDGKQLWKRDVGGLTMGSPVMAGGALIVASGFPERSVFKINADDGAVIWQTPAAALAQFSNSSAAVAGDQVIIGANGGHYYSFDLATGALRWTYEAEGIVNLASPVVLGGRVYILPGGGSQKLHAVDVTTGAAVAGWPIALDVAAPDIEGTPLSREFSVSSLAAVDGRIVFDFRADDAYDSNGDGESDRFLMREFVTAVDASSGAVLWQQGNGRVVTDDPIVVPKMWLCPTPAVWKASAEGNAYIAVASTLTASVRVLDPATGAEVSRADTAGPAQISPVVANGRLFVGGLRVIEGLLSSVNQPPAAPQLLPSQDDELTKTGVTLHWAPAEDPNGDAVMYHLRLDRDGELLQDWTREMTADPSVGGIEIPGSFEPGVTYNVAMRARDVQGAWSDWSVSGTFALPAPPAPPEPTPAPVDPADLTSALLAARSGDVFNLGAGTFTLSRTLRIPAGVSLKGAGPGRTILQASGLAVAVSIDGGSGDPQSGTPSRISHVTITGAEVAISVRDVTGAHISHVILRDNTQAGVEVHAGARAQLINGTLLRTGHAVKSQGTISVKNSLISESRVAFWAASESNIVSRYNDVWDNELDYRGAAPGEGDIGMVVQWADGKRGDVRLLPRQASTDRGDPADDFSAEPLPNGGRINLGAYGGTDEAELSAAAIVDPEPVATPDDDGGGCAFAGSTNHTKTTAGLNGTWSLLVLAVVAAFRRRRRE